MGAREDCVFSHDESLHEFLHDSRLFLLFLSSDKKVPIGSLLGLLKDLEKLFPSKIIIAWALGFDHELTFKSHLRKDTL